jgi:hypothetical protein
MEIFNYSEAIKCLKEALVLSEEKNPNVYFRLGQARLYNKFSKEEDWANAMSDFSKAKRLLTNEDINHQYEVKELRNLLDNEYNSLLELIKSNEEKIKHKNKSKFLYLINDYNRIS